MKGSAAVCVALLLIMVSTTANTISFFPGTKHAYELVSIQDFHSAHEDAASRALNSAQGHIVVIDSEEENNWLQETFPATAFWIGAYDNSGLSTWYVYSDGPLTGRNLDYENFAFTPTKAWGCIQFQPSGKWVAGDCTSTAYLIVEYECADFTQYMTADGLCNEEIKYCKKRDDVAPTKCQECLRPYYLTKEGLCQQTAPKCGPGWYKISDPTYEETIKCVSCFDPYCDVCINEFEGSCHKCQEGFKRSESGKCDSCADGYFDNGDGCVPCEDSHCQQCTGSGTGVCSQCFAPTILTKDATCACANIVCGPHGTCTPGGRSDDYCHCDDGYAGSRCHAPCPVGFHGHNCHLPYRCENCADNRFCIKDNVCLKCAKGYWLDEDICVATNVHSPRENVI